MRTPPRLFLRLLLATVVLAIAADGSAQSALDGFYPRPNFEVWAVAPQPDGKILIGGMFTTITDRIGIVSRNGIARLNADGTVDRDFNPGANSWVASVLVQPNGQIIVTGTFTALGGGTGTTPRNGIGRLNPDGSVDPTFTPSASGVDVMIPQPDGKILLCGEGTFRGNTGSTTHRWIGRLNEDGSLDLSFNAQATGAIRDCALQQDGKIVIVGDFMTYGTATRQHIARLNPDGSLDTAFDPGADQAVWTVAIEADGRMIVAGQFTGIGGGNGSTTRNRVARLDAAGRVDESFDPNLSGSVVTDIALQQDGKAVLAGLFSAVGGTARRNIARLHSDGTLDQGYNPGANNTVKWLAIQQDGGVIALGAFTALGGGTGTTLRAGIGRLYPDGSVDKDLVADAFTVSTIAVQPDGKILIGGNFSTVAGMSRLSIARLSPDGTPDSFNPGATWAGTNAVISALVVQPDGKILTAGQFTTLGGGGTTPKRYVGQLNADGTLDNAFDPRTDGPGWHVMREPEGTLLVTGGFRIPSDGTGNTVKYMVARLRSDGTLDPGFTPPAIDGLDWGALTSARQDDGKIIVGGIFTMAGGIRQHLARLNPDGSLDGGFNPGVNGWVRGLIIQPDGKILVAGDFSRIGGGGTGTVVRNRIARLNPDGSVDPTFNPGANGIVFAMALQADGGILVGGDFTALGGGSGSTPRMRIGRLHSNGTVDTSFTASADGSVSTLLLQHDGKVLVGGSFRNLTANVGYVASRAGLGRLTNPVAALQRLHVDPSGRTVTWLRGGSAPDVSRVTFEWSPDGVAYSSLGVGARVAGGWHLGALSLPRQGPLFVRARGMAPNGSDGSSLVESVIRVDLSPAAFTDQSLTAGYLIKAIHVIELRARIDALRLAHGLPLFQWTDASLAGVPARAVHVQDLRVALSEAYVAAGAAWPELTDQTIVPGATAIRAAHILELRAAVLALELR